MRHLRMQLCIEQPITSTRSKASASEAGQRAGPAPPLVASSFRRMQNIILGESGLHLEAPSAFGTFMLIPNGFEAGHFSMHTNSDSNVFIFLSNTLQIQSEYVFLFFFLFFCFFPFFEKI